MKFIGLLYLCLPVVLCCNAVFAQEKLDNTALAKEIAQRKRQNVAAVEHLWRDRTKLTPETRLRLDTCKNSIMQSRGSIQPEAELQIQKKIEEVISKAIRELTPNESNSPKGSPLKAQTSARNESTAPRQNSGYAIDFDWGQPMYKMQRKIKDAWQTKVYELATSVPRVKQLPVLTVRMEVTLTPDGVVRNWSCPEKVDTQHEKGLLRDTIKNGGST